MTTDPDTKNDDSACGCGVGSCSGLGKWIWILLAVALVGVLIARNVGKKPGAASALSSGVTPAAVEARGPQGVPLSTESAKVLPRLVDLGARKCIPCKMMAPILEDLKKNYMGKLDVQFIDVWENPDAGKTYGIDMIPTQIFYDRSGKELFRHEGFWGKEDILAKWKELGLDLGPEPKGEGVGKEGMAE
jgi:thioredoxin 1